MTVMRCNTRSTASTLRKLLVISLLKRSIRQRLLWAWNQNAYDFTEKRNISVEELLDKVRLPHSYARSHIMTGYIERTDVRERVREFRRWRNPCTPIHPSIVRLNVSREMVPYLISERLEKLCESVDNRGTTFGAAVWADGGAYVPDKTWMDRDINQLQLLLSDYMMRPRNSDNENAIYVGPFMWMQRVKRSDGTHTWEFHQL